MENAIVIKIIFICQKKMVHAGNKSYYFLNRNFFRQKVELNNK